MIPHGLKVSTNQEKVDPIAILPFKLLNAFVDIVELSVAATLDSNLKNVIKEGIVRKLGFTFMVRIWWKVRDFICVCVFTTLQQLNNLNCVVRVRNINSKFEILECSTM